MTTFHTIPISKEIGNNTSIENVHRVFYYHTSPTLSHLPSTHTAQLSPPSVNEVFVHLIFLININLIKHLSHLMQVCKSPNIIIHISTSYLGLLHFSGIIKPNMCISVNYYSWTPPFIRFLVDVASLIFASPTSNGPQHSTQMDGYDHFHQDLSQVTLSHRSNSQKKEVIYSKSKKKT